MNHIQEVINTYTAEFKQIPSIDRTLANRYKQKLVDIQYWLQITEWSHKQLPESTLIKIQNTFVGLFLVSSRVVGIGL